MTWSPGQVSQNRTSNWVGCTLNLISSCCLGHFDIPRFPSWMVYLSTFITSRWDAGSKDEWIERTSGNFVGHYNNNGGTDGRSYLLSCHTPGESKLSKVEGKATGVCHSLTLFLELVMNRAGSCCLLLAQPGVFSREQGNGPEWMAVLQVSQGPCDSSLFCSLLESWLNKPV